MKYKEFLNKNDNYNLVMLPEHAGDDERSGLIEVPDGAQLLSTDGYGKALIFWKDDFNLVVGLDDCWDRVHHNFNYFFSEYPRCKVLWKRYTQPESLPFVDDEVQSINDQYAEIEKVRQTQIGGNHYSKLAIQPMEYSLANGLDAGQHTVIKYVTRFKDKGGIEDLHKAKHTIDLLIANYYGVEK